MIYIKKFDYTDLNRGERKKAETANGRALLKTAVGREFGVNSDALTIEKGEHGKPYFAERKDIFFNISHSGDYVAAAVGKSPLGVDIQIVRSVREGMYDRLCNYNEKRFIENSGDSVRAFIILWSLKESYVKAIGKGMSFPMNEVNFTLSEFGGEEQGELSNRSGYFYVKDFGEFILAACSLEGRSDFSVVKE